MDAIRYILDSSGYDVLVKLIESNLYGCNNILNTNTFINTNTPNIHFYCYTSALTKP